MRIIRGCAVSNRFIERYHDDNVKDDELVGVSVRISTSYGHHNKECDEFFFALDEVETIMRIDYDHKYGHTFAVIKDLGIYVSFCEMGYKYIGHIEDDYNDFQVWIEDYVLPYEDDELVKIKYNFGVDRKSDWVYKWLMEVNN